ncbi:MAG: DUF4931 domain-containing protein [Clostridia bacterium]|jgi:galactose-1-phosphate uridylyltransferase|nr:DUF4931 domain-containing protein [Clostridia bacterium]
MTYNLLSFKSSIGTQKFAYNDNLKEYCPFCDREHLTDILDKDGKLLLVKNKFQVLEDAYLTVLIETETCQDEFSNYPRAYLHRVMRFGFKHWLAMESSGEYASVLYFKNHGPLSGGSLHHPHMQIVGLNKINYQENISPESFIGVPVHQSGNVEFTISTKPLVGFTEFNVILPDLNEIDTLADYVQTASHYILNHFNRCKSYNIFFYHLDRTFYAKIVPRFVTTPVFVGYRISQVTDRIYKTAAEIRELYFT